MLRRTGASGKREPRLPTKSEAGKQAVVPVNVRVAQVPQLAATLANEHKQPAARVEVVTVLSQVIGERLDAIREERNLHFRGPGVSGKPCEIADDLGLLFKCLHSVRRRTTGQPVRPEPAVPSLLPRLFGADPGDIYGVYHTISVLGRRCAFTRSSPLC